MPKTKTKKKRSRSSSYTRIKVGKKRSRRLKYTNFDSSQTTQQEISTPSREQIRAQAIAEFEQERAAFVKGDFTTLNVLIKEDGTRKDRIVRIQVEDQSIF